MSLINLGAGLSAAGSSLSEYAGTIGLTAQKAELEKQQSILADQLATTRETKLEGVRFQNQKDIIPIQAESQINVGAANAEAQGGEQRKTDEARAGLPMTAAEKAAADELKREHNILAVQGRIKFEKDAMGNIVPFDTETQKFVKPADIGLPENMSQDNAAETAKQIYEYRKKPLSGFVLKSPYGQMVQDEINKLDAEGQKAGTPAYNEQYYATSQKARNDFSTGPLGNTVRSGNVWSHHLLMLKNLGEAMDNGDSQTVTKIKQDFQREFNDPTLSSYEAIAPLVGEEGAKFIMAGKSTGPEREKFLEPLVSARDSTSRNAAINTLLGAAGAQIRGLKKQYENNVRSKDFEDKLDPEIAKLISEAQSPDAASSTSQTTAPANAKTVVPPGTYVWTPQGLVPKK